VFQVSQKSKVGFTFFYYTSCMNTKFRTCCD